MSESTYYSTNTSTNRKSARRSSKGFCGLRFLWLWFIGGVLLTMVFLSMSFMDSGNGRIFAKNFAKMVGNFRLRYKFQQKPIILAWTGFFSKVNWLPNLKDLGCPVDCQVTHQRNLSNLSSAVIFHLRDLNAHDLPLKIKNYSQMWVLYNLEAPPHVNSNKIRALNGKIHWTATYRADSDFFTPYGKIVPRSSNKLIKDSSSFTKKSKFVCWIVSHCSTPSHREQYAKDLGEYVPVTIYGQCGHNVCPTAKAMDCYQHISKDCKFYLSFENSICKNYVTEKLFYALQTDMVPIVMGGENYSQILPKDSFIDVLDYNTSEDLAHYLLQLDEDPLLYKKYHRWKNDYEVKKSNYKWVCDLCQRLYNEDLSTIKPYENLDSWWLEEAHCKPKILITI